MDLSILEKPFSASDIEWRVGTAKNGLMTVLAYYKSTTVMSRMDKAFGVLGWKSTLIPIGEPVIKGYRCIVEVYDDEKNTWISREGVGEVTGIAALKGGASDAFKRACVLFGLGRNLYHLPQVMISTDDKFIPKWARNRLFEIAEMVTSGASYDKNMPIKITDKTTKNDIAKLFSSEKQKMTIKLTDTSMINKIAEAIIKGTRTIESVKNSAILERGVEEAIERVIKEANESGI